MNDDADLALVHIEYRLFRFIFEPTSKINGIVKWKKKNEKNKICDDFQHAIHKYPISSVDSIIFILTISHKGEFKGNWRLAMGNWLLVPFIRIHLFNAIKKFN